MLSLRKTGTWKQCYVGLWPVLLRLHVTAGTSHTVARDPTCSLHLKALSVSVHISYWIVWNSIVSRPSYTVKILLLMSAYTKVGY
jgi:hypothetical protein